MEIICAKKNATKAVVICVYPILQLLRHVHVEKLHCRLKDIRALNQFRAVIRYVIKNYLVVSLVILTYAKKIVIQESAQHVN